jgi:uncharacterized membrane protein
MLLSFMLVILLNLICRIVIMKWKRQGETLRKELYKRELLKEN